MEVYGQTIFSQLEIIAPWIEHINVGGYFNSINPIYEIYISENFTSLNYLSIHDCYINRIVIEDLPSLDYMHIGDDCWGLSEIDLQNFIPNGDSYDYMINPCEFIPNEQDPYFCLMLQDPDWYEIYCTENVFLNTTGVNCNVIGCNNDDACNFDDEAEYTDDFVCDFPTDLIDCDGVCIDTSACNYLSEAIYTCYYAQQGEDCEGNCLFGESNEMNFYGSYCIIPGCADCSALNYYNGFEYDCNEYINFDDGSCIYPDIGINPSNDECENILFWAFEWMISDGNAFITESGSSGENQTYSNPFEYAVGLNIEIDECFSNSIISLDPPDNWQDISIEILDIEINEVINTINPGDTLEIPLQEPIEEEDNYGYFYENGCP